jgi:hypothetical protein
VILYNLIVSSGRAKVRFGDYVGSDYDVTAAQLRAQGYEVQKTSQASDTVAAGINHCTVNLMLMTKLTQQKRQ